MLCYVMQKSQKLEPAKISCRTVAQLVYLRLVEISNPVKFNLNYLFQVFARPH